MVDPPPKGVVNEDIVLIEVDDIFEGTSPAHRAKMDAFYKRWQCGKYKTLRKEGRKALKHLVFAWYIIRTTASIGI